MKKEEIMAIKEYVSAKIAYSNCGDSMCAIDCKGRLMKASEKLNNLEDLLTQITSKVCHQQKL